ncbi:Hsp70 family protein [Aspergillus melleus]|uniref:Hsp70 family protein n=1 Tax=Aspergillus melleus TaxID=138277 RepID=UPI001E8EBE40|nr:uncharacterized protein LDX57_001802 [Aspergillus melleus]KAH8424046.1 hypothetical protein LDX57_001802 [Aspergillus melleus]
MVATYLEKLNQHIWGLLKGRNIDADSTPIEYWLAAPAHWREETKLLLMQAAEEAGFKAKPADRIHMVSEAEAAALSVLHTFASRLEVNDGLLVCDCGGGTVDIGTFYISDVEPRLFFEELTAVQGGKCGGAAVDSRFYQLLRSQLGDALQSVPSAQLGAHGKLMTNFQSNIKSGFTGRAEESFHIPLELHGVAKMDSSIYDGRRKHVILTSEHLRQIFDPVLDRILELIIKQKAAADRKFGREVIHVRI